MSGYLETEGSRLITSVDNVLAQQIVDTVKDVCGYDINFIHADGIIFASTNPDRIGTFHEIGKRAAYAGTTIEVAEDDSYAGTQQGINMPVYHNGRLIAVVGITGIPDEVRKYAYLAERITSLLIREQEINAFSRSQADKKNFIVTSLARGDQNDQSYFAECLKEYRIDTESRKRFLIIRINSRYNLVNLSLLEQKIGQLFNQAGVVLYTFRYPREFLAVIDAEDYEKSSFLFRGFSRKNPDLVEIAVGKASSIFNLNQSYDSAVTALKSLGESESNFADFDNLTLELILSSVDESSRKEFLKKTLSHLSEEDMKIADAYFAEDMSLSNTSRKLFLHKNTLQYKLNHICQKSSLNPRSFHDAVFLYLALRVS